MPGEADHVDPREAPARTHERLPWGRLALLCLVVLAALYPSLAPAQDSVVAARIWPSPEYTRVTIESGSPIAHTVFAIPDPPRVVLDLQHVEPNAHLESLTARVAADDPQVATIRIGRFKPNVLRIVFEVKQPIRPEAFTIAPVGEYGHRLVLDLYAATPPDPLMALVSRLERGEGVQAPESQAAPGTQRPASATPTPAVARPSAPPERRPVIIAIDAGHGGEDPGAIGRLGTYEKTITLSVARRLQALIDAEPDLRAVLTRTGDYFVPLHVRVARARRVKADLFVSIHADAFIKPHARGSSVFALSERGATSAAARWLAKRENDADLVGGANLDVQDPYLKRTLLDLSQTATINDSLKLGRAVLDQLGRINTLHKRDVEQAGFAVLKAPDIPSILVETAFISNPEEERRLRDPRYQTRMAEAVLAGIKRYLEARPPLARPPHMALAPAP